MYVGCIGDGKSDSIMVWLIGDVKRNKYTCIRMVVLSVRLNVERILNTVLSLQHEHSILVPARALPFLQ